MYINYFNGSDEIRSCCSHANRLVVIKHPQHDTPAFEVICNNPDHWIANVKVIDEFCFEDGALSQDFWRVYQEATNTYGSKTN